MKEHWIGVRPVRFRDEIYSILELIVSRPNGILIEEMRNTLLNLRLKREDRRLKALQRSISLESKKRKKIMLLTKAEQMLRVLNRIDLVTKNGNVISATSLSKNIINIKHQDEISADALFIEYLINSPFHTYWLFLKQLYTCQQLLIPNSLSKRDTKLRTYLNSNGFLMDIWSFFIIRDLFYEFSLLNYTVDESYLKIFPLYDIEKDPSECSPYKYLINGPDASLRYWKKPTEDFINNLAKIYLELTDNRWNRMIDLIGLREKYSIKFCVPERQFNILLMQTQNQVARFKVVLSVGSFSFNAQSTYIIKALSLPTNQYGLPYSLIRMEVGEN